MARVLTITVNKGGSAKSTTALNLATALQQKHQRTLCIDLDPQSDVTLAAGINPLSLEKHVHTLFVDYNVQPRDVFTTTRFGLTLLPSHPDLSTTEAGMRATQVGILKGIIEPIEDQFDFIIIDTPRLKSYLTVSALVATDEVIIPLQPHFLAVSALKDTLDEIENVRRGLNQKLRVAGVLPVMVNSRTNISKLMLEQVKAHYPELLYPFQVNFSIKHVESSLAGEPILIYAPHHQGSQAYTKLAETFL